ncbi:MAG: cytochrome ubiquinol oxidase subunit I [Bacteroidetes bacterium]|nr:MAG: cytochrome ubiquinol oxidase subunit I [Bacteroidota bacterium]
MDVELLARIQFAFTIAFHYLYPPLSIGLGVLLVAMEGLYLRTGNKVYERMTRFWVKIFALTFAMGVATGIVMEFEFGTNWAVYSRYVGDVFGSALAAEGIFAFFLESGFLAVLVFGWDRVSPRMHFFSTCMVSLGSMMSAVWIVVANSWMQTPAGFRIAGEGMSARAEITDFWAMVFNPSSMERLAHTLSGAWLAGATLVLSVSAYYLLKRRHTDIALRSMKIATVLLVFASLFQLFTGHRSAVGVSRNQPAKMAAFEAHYDSSAPAPFYLFGWVNEEEQRVNVGIAVPGMLSLLIHGDRTAPVTGLNAFPPDERPPVNVVFQFYHLMVASGMALIALGFLFAFLWARGRLADQRWALRLGVASVLLPQIANQAGWFAAEIGRQPWIVYGLLRTSDALSRTVTKEHIVFSLVLFGVIYALLFALFLFLLDQKIKHGPDEPEGIASEYEHQKQLLHG